MATNATEAFLEANIEQIYEWVLRTANRYLYLCNRHSFTILQLEENPSFESLARDLQIMSTVIGALRAYLDETQVGRAQEHCEIMVKISEAITAEDQLEFDAIVRALRVELSMSESLLGVIGA
jgi:hypothetical protein